MVRDLNNSVKLAPEKAPPPLPPPKSNPKELANPKALPNPPLPAFSSSKAKDKVAVYIGFLLME